MRSEAAPHLIVDGGSAEPLERIKLGGTEIRETLLQELLDENPGILPVADFDESFGPVMSLGREIMGIDNLFISPNGRLTVVETKLWRNPQATRHVLAQILDYASRLAALDYEKFETHCGSANRSPVSASSGLYRMVTEAFPDETGGEAEFIDSLQKNLRTGRFLLLVVGDGIRESLESILDALHHQSRLHFTFGLVELKLYRQPDGAGILAVPNVIAHSTEIERAVVTIRGAESADIDVEVRSDPQEKAPRLSEQEFVENIKNPKARVFVDSAFEWARKHGRIDILKKSAAIRVPFLNRGKGLLVMRIFRSGSVVVTPPRLRSRLQKLGAGEELIFEIAHGLQALFPELQIDSNANALISALPAEHLAEKAEEVLQIYSRAADRAAAMESEATGELDEEEDESGNSC